MRAAFAFLFACATVSLAELASANVVGYQTTSISGYKMATPTFKNVSTEEYPIDNFTVQGATDAQTKIQVLDADGQVSGTYYWYNAYNEYPAGWFDFAGLVPAEISLKPGDAVFFYTAETGVTIQSAGEVMGDVTRDVAGYSMLGNCSPVTISIDSLTVQGATDAQTKIQVLNSEGSLTS